MFRFNLWAITKLEALIVNRTKLFPPKRECYFSLKMIIEELFS